MFPHFVLGIINEIVLTDDNFSCKFLARLIRYLKRRKQLMNACKICGFFSCSIFFCRLPQCQGTNTVSQSINYYLKHEPILSCSKFPQLPLLLTYQPLQWVGEYHVELRNRQEIQTGIYKENGKIGV